jgi:hypothetical protein
MAEDDDACYLEGITDLFCPIDHQCLLEAAMTSNQKLYNGPAIRQWFNLARLNGAPPRCPLSNETLISMVLRPVYTMSSIALEISSRVKAMRLTARLEKRRPNTGQ